MGVFTDEYGEPIAWRIAVMSLAGVAVTAAITFALCGQMTARGAEETKEEEVVTVVTPPQDTGDGGLGAWLAGVEGSERLRQLGEDDLRAMMLAVRSWQASAGMYCDASLAVVGDVDTGTDGTHVRMLVRGQTTETWLELVRSPDGTWVVTERPWGFDGDMEARIAVTDTAAMSGLLGIDVAGELVRQLLSSGIAGVEGAWTKASAVTGDGEAKRLTIWVPTTEGAEAVPYDAAFDRTLGLLEVALAGEPLEVAR